MNNLKKEIKILAQTHTHTIYSPHAYSTIAEYAKTASDEGLELIAITDHGPAMHDSGHIWHFLNMNILPREIFGVCVLRGCEANIIDYEGKLDMEEGYLKRLDFVIASVHTTSTLRPSSNDDDHTNTYLKVLDNPYVGVIGHPGWHDFRFDIDKVLKKAKEKGVLIEINAHTATTRPKNMEICREIAKKCAELGVGIVVGADAHCSFELTKLDDALSMLYSIDFPEELIMNTTKDKLLNHISKRRGVTIEEYLIGKTRSLEKF